MRAWIRTKTGKLAFLSDFSCVYHPLTVSDLPYRSPLAHSSEINCLNFSTFTILRAVRETCRSKRIVSWSIDESGIKCAIIMVNCDAINPRYVSQQHPNKRSKHWNRIRRSGNCSCSTLATRCVSETKRWSKSHVDVVKQAGGSMEFLDKN